MKKSWILTLILLSLYGCGSYTLQTKNRGYDIQSILAVTKTGDTIQVPYNSNYFNQQTNYGNTSWNFSPNWNNRNNNYYRNNWDYGLFYPGYNWNFHRPIYYSTPIRPRVQPKTKPRPRINVPRPRNPRLRD